MRRLLLLALIGCNGDKDDTPVDEGCGPDHVLAQRRAAVAILPALRRLEGMQHDESEPPIVVLCGHRGGHGWEAPQAPQVRGVVREECLQSQALHSRVERRRR